MQSFAQINGSYVYKRSISHPQTLAFSLTFFLSLCLSFTLSVRIRMQQLLAGDNYFCRLILALQELRDVKTRVTLPGEKALIHKVIINAHVKID